MHSLPVDQLASGNVRPGWHVVAWDGEVDMARAPELLARTIGTRPGSSGLVVDLATVNFIDAAGIGALVSARAHLRTAGSELMVRNPSAMVCTLCELLSLSDLLEPPVVDSSPPEWSPLAPDERDTAPEPPTQLGTSRTVTASPSAHGSRRLGLTINSS